MGDVQVAIDLPYRRDPRPFKVQITGSSLEKVSAALEHAEANRGPSYTMLIP